uniref:Secreted protein n=1 Tax=Macaca fascicularis TaxID=9541 RepID=A0A7N9CZT8_MACFA
MLLTELCHLFIFLRPGLAVSLRVEGSGVVMPHCSLCFPDSSNPPISASQVIGITVVPCNIWLIFVFFFVETGFCHVAQAGLECLSNPRVSASQCWDYRHEPPHPANSVIFDRVDEGL